MKLIHRILLALLTGLLLVLTIPPVNIKILGWVALVPLLISIDRTRWRNAFLLGMLTGLLYFGIGFYWLAIYSKQAFMITLLVASGFVGLFCMFIKLLERYFDSAWKKIILAPLVWVSLAYVFSFTPLESYWTHFAEPQPIYLLQIIAVIGMAGLTFLMVMSNSILASYIVNREKTVIKAAIVLALILTASLFYGMSNVKNDISGDLLVAAVQPNFPDSMEWRKEHIDEIFKTYEQLILEARDADIIVLPLYTLPVSLNTTIKKLESLSRITESYITLGTYRGNTNIALLFSPQGKFIGEYAAVHKPPFRNQTPGNEYTVTQTNIGKIGMLLCYDTTHEKTTREFVRKNAELLLSMANDNDFLGTTEPEHHLEKDVLRAVQNKRYIVRAAPSGISAIIDPYGRVLNKSEIGKKQIIFGKVKLIKEKTIFTQIGDIVSPIALLVLVIMYLLRRRKKQNNKSFC